MESKAIFAQNCAVWARRFECDDIVEIDKAINLVNKLGLDASSRRAAMFAVAFKALKASYSSDIDVVSTAKAAWAVADVLGRTLYDSTVSPQEAVRTLRVKLLNDGCTPLSKIIDPAVELFERGRYGHYEDKEMVQVPPGVGHQVARTILNRYGL